MNHLNHNQNQVPRTLSLVSTVILGFFTAITFASPSFADDVKKNITLDGKQTQLSVDLESQESHPIYERRLVPAVCEREELKGYREECTTEQRESCTISEEQVCRTEYTYRCRTIYRQRCNDPRFPGHCVEVPVRICDEYPETVCNLEPVQSCTTYPETVCKQVPEYQTIEYACEKWQDVKIGDVVDFEVASNVSINVTTLALTGASAPKEVLELIPTILNRNKNGIDAKLNGSTGQYIVQINKVKEVSQVTGPKTKQVDVQFEVRLVQVDLLKTYAPTKVLELSSEQGLLTTVVKTSGDPEKFLSLFDFELHVTRFETVNSAVMVFSGRVPDNAVQVLQATPGQLALSVDLKTIGRNLHLGAEHKVLLKLVPKSKGIVNRPLMPSKLESEVMQNLVIK